jgi:hypothetical protein
MSHQVQDMLDAGVVSTRLAVAGPHPASSAAAPASSVPRDNIPLVVNGAATRRSSGLDASSR